MRIEHALDVLADALATPGLSDERRAELILYPPRRDVQATPLHPPVETSTPASSRDTGVGTSQVSGGLDGHREC